MMSDSTADTSGVCSWVRDNGIKCKKVAKRHGQTGADLCKIHHLLSLSGRPPTKEERQKLQEEERERLARFAAKYRANKDAIAARYDEVQRVEEECWNSKGRN
jgi:hypothetical protein